MCIHPAQRRFEARGFLPDYQSAVGRATDPGRFFRAQSKYHYDPSSPYSPATRNNAATIRGAFVRSGPSAESQMTRPDRQRHRGKLRLEFRSTAFSEFPFARFRGSVGYPRPCRRHVQASKPVRRAYVIVPAQIVLKVKTNEKRRVLTPIDSAR